MAPITYRFRRFGPLTPAEQNVLDRMAEPAVEVGRREVIRAEGTPVTGVFVLEAGWVASSFVRHGGGRMVVQVHLPGDFLGASSLPCVGAAETLTALTPALVSHVPLGAIGKLFETQPRLAALLFLDAQQERVALADRIAAIGRSSAAGSVAGFLLNIHERLGAIKPVLPPAFELPLTLDDIGDALGLSAVHVSRTLTRLAAAGLIRRRRRQVELLDIPGLAEQARTPERARLRDLGWLPPPVA